MEDGESATRLQPIILKSSRVTCTLYHGDCMDVLPTLSGVDAVVTDPPYGIAYDASGSSQRGIQPFAMIQGDDKPFDVSPFLEFDDVLAWCRPQWTLNVPVGVGGWYAWDKTLQNNGCRIAECEYAWHKRATKTRVFRHLWSGAYRASESGIQSVHPTQKPIALMVWCLSHVKEHTILDPFMGSGTTGVACICEGRNFIGIEKDEKYFQIAVERIRRELQQERLF